MKTTIKTYGELADLTVPEFAGNVCNTREAVDLLVCNFPDIETYFIRAHERGVAFRVVVGEDWELGEDELLDPTQGNTIHIYCVPMGAGGGLFKIIAGVALIGLAFSGVGLFGLSPLLTGVLGGAMLLSGFMNTNKPDAPDPDETGKSFIFSNATNTTAVGGRVPISYGYDLWTGSYVLSASIRSFAVSD